MSNSQAQGWHVDYNGITSDPNSAEAKVVQLKRKLSKLWCDRYVAMTPRRVEIFAVESGTFHYLFDFPMHAPIADQSQNAVVGRLVGVLGVSQVNTKPRDDSRLKGWIGPTNTTFGKDWDKGHFIAHSIGGAVEGCEFNVFVQRRDVNRGDYRHMERYCAANPGTFCFSRPIYSDLSATPTWVEFGLLEERSGLIVRKFGNR